MSHSHIPYIMFNVTCVCRKFHIFNIILMCQPVLVATPPFDTRKCFYCLECLGRLYLSHWEYSCSIYILDQLLLTCLGLIITMFHLGVTSTSGIMPISFISAYWVPSFGNPKWLILDLCPKPQAPNWHPVSINNPVQCAQLLNWSFVCSTILW